MVYVAGIDIGGTKCAVTIGSVSDEGVTVSDKIRMQTPASPHEAVPMLVEALKELVKRNPDKPVGAVGISCGGPLDSKNGRNSECRARFRTTRTRAALRNGSGARGRGARI